MYATRFGHIVTTLGPNIYYLKPMYTRLKTDFLCKLLDATDCTDVSVI
jgi:hypothetical protein